MSIGNVDFISGWRNKEAYAKLANNRNVHDPEAMMNGFGEAYGFEAAVGSKNVIDAGLLELLAKYRRAVCKISCSGVDFRGLSLDWSGTGFLVGPNLLVTNNHVINSVAVAATATVDFEYERSPGDLLSQKSTSRNARQTLTLDPSRLFYTDPAKGGLDFTFVWIGEEAAKDYGFIPMSRASFAGRIYDPVFLIHHPSGDFKQVSVDDTELLNVDADLLLYAADTEGGSSGAPVITRNGKLCGLHHAFRRDQSLIDKHGKRARTLQDGQSYTVANEGIQFSAIAVHLESELSRTNSNRATLLDILKQFVDVDTVTGPYGVLGRETSARRETGVESTAENGTNGEAKPQSSLHIMEAYNATHQDVDVAVWNMEWINSHKDDGAILRRVATVFADITQDVWVLDGISRETTIALRDVLEGSFKQKFAFAIADEEAHHAQPVTALIYNTKAVKIRREPWPEHVADLWRSKARADLELQTLTGPIFPSFPARFVVEVLGRDQPFKFTLVPLFVGEHGNILLRKAVAAQIMTEVVEEMAMQSRIGGDWLIAGDVNAPLRRTRVESIEDVGFQAILARDPERGGFSYLREDRKSILSQLFVPEGTEQIGNDAGMITTVPQVFRRRYVDALTSKAPYGVRLSLMDEASARDIRKAVEVLENRKTVGTQRYTFESAASDWQWQGLSKSGFMRANAPRIRALVDRVNAQLSSEYGASHTALSIIDLFILIYCEAGYRNGAMDPEAHHSLGERGLLPLPNNLDFWLGGPAPSHDAALPLARNISLYAAYLGQVKNKKVKNSAHGYLYCDLFLRPGIAGEATRQAKLLAGIIHGYFLTANYRGGKAPDFPHMLSAYAGDLPIQVMLRGSGYVHDGTTILRNRQSNVDGAVQDYAQMSGLF